MDVATLVDLADQPCGYLRTTGRRSGRPHTIEIWFAVRRAKYRGQVSGTKQD
jgi:hypothetical protein